MTFFFCRLTMPRYDSIVEHIFRINQKIRFAGNSRALGLHFAIRPNHKSNRILPNTIKEFHLGRTFPHTHTRTHITVNVPKANNKKFFSYHTNISGNTYDLFELARLNSTRTWQQCPRRRRMRRNKLTPNYGMYRHKTAMHASIVFRFYLHRTHHCAPNDE